MSNLKWLFEITINSIDDFPVQDATTITLNTWNYSIRDVLVTDKQFILADWAIVEFLWWDPSISGLVYTWTLAAFKGEDFVSFTHDHVFISTPLGTIFDMDNVSPVWAQIFIEDTVYIDCAWIWVVKNIAQFSGYFNAFTDIWQGFDLDSVRLINIAQSTSNGWKNEVSTMFTFSWDIDSIQLNGIEYIPDSNESVFDFKVWANIVSANITWNVFNKTLSGTLFAAWSRNQTDIFLNFDANSGMSKSIVFGNMYLWTTEQVAITQNVISVVNDATTWWANIWTELWDTSRFTFDSTLWRYTYIWLEIANVEIISTTSLEKQWGGSDYIETILLLNWLEIIWSAIGTDNTNPTSVTSIWDVEIDTWDYLEIGVRNTDSSSNINISVSNFIIKD